MDHEGAGTRGPHQHFHAFSGTSTLASSRFLFFGGKGGVGKTTAACAAALSLLERSKDGEHILLFSTDPAHSLSDSLGIDIGDRIIEVARSGTTLMAAWEIDPAAALSKFKTRHGATLREIAERGTFLDESDVNGILDLSLPGLDEVMALFELSEFDRTGVFHHIVIDTAPSGHTWRLLGLPEVFTHWISALDRMSDKHRYIVAQFTRGRRGHEDEVDLFIRDLTQRIQRVRTMFFDAAQASFTLVAIPTAMSFEETARYLTLLVRTGVPVTDLIVNRIEGRQGGCPLCNARAVEQKPWFERFSLEFAALRLHKVPLLAQEVRGFDGLRQFAHLAWESADGGTQGNFGQKNTPVGDTATQSGLLIEGSSKVRDLPLQSRRLLVFGGKGGVGKTTAAAAAALALAESDSQACVLIFSTDPAHSLSDCFGESLGELKRGVAGRNNLDAMEIEPAKGFEALKERFRAWTDQLFTSLGRDSRWQIQFDREAMHELVALAPPGIDEIIALSELNDLLNEGRYTSIVLDCAPTGHLVRFLELPDVALSWVRTFIKLLLKYKDVVQWDGLAEELISLSKSIKRISALLSDANQCEFIGVAIPEKMSLEETVRLTEALERLRVPMRSLLINNVVPAEVGASCSFCHSRRQAQEKVIESFRQRLGGTIRLSLAPQQPHEVRGVQRLREHFLHWQALHDFA